MEARRLIVAMAAAMAIFIGYQMLLARLLPKPPPNAAATQPVPPAAVSETPGATTPTISTPSAPATTADRQAPFSFTAGPSDAGIKIGGGPGDYLELELTPRGAAVSTIRLCERDAKRDRYIHRAGPRTNEPYTLLTPVEDAGRPRYSFVTHKLLIVERNSETWQIDDLVWQVAESDPTAAAGQVTFTTALRALDKDVSLVRLIKTYQLLPSPLLMGLELVVENVSDQSLTVVLEQDGPLGIRQEGLQYDMRRLITGKQSGEKIDISAVQRPELLKATRAGEPRTLGSFEGDPKLVWSALTNKFFAVFTRPLPTDDGQIDYLALVKGDVAAPDREDNPGDLVARFITTRLALRPGEFRRLRFEIYAGPKDSEILKRSNPAFADRSQLGYSLAQSADTTCMCTFHPLPELMTGLLHGIYYVVRNYGIAIVILVIIVRTLLHPLTVFQQKSMFRMQEAMARVQPKLQAIKERFANDKVRQNQEMMKLWAEEHVNPMASMISFVPLLLQMPILVALWTGLNTDIHLRNAPFDGYWISDLSAPDALLRFAPPGLTIPILGWLPLVGSWFTHIQSLNLLPVLMGVSMWLQQKYMPKPGMQAKPDAAKQQPTPAPTERKGRGLTPEEQLRQQRMMSYMMAVLFPLMFYNMPAGLNLYWMATNVFGIVESLIIRKQLQRDKERREREGPKPRGPRKPGLLGRFFKHLADQAEQVQKRADQISQKR